MLWSGADLPIWFEIDLLRKIRNIFPRSARRQLFPFVCHIHQNPGYTAAMGQGIVVCNCNVQLEQIIVFQLYYWYSWEAWTKFILRRYSGSESFTVLWYDNDNMTRYNDITLTLKQQIIIEKGRLHPHIFDIPAIIDELKCLHQNLRIA